MRRFASLLLFLALASGCSKGSSTNPAQSGGQAQTDAPASGQTTPPEKLVTEAEAKAAMQEYIEQSLFGKNVKILAISTAMDPPPAKQYGMLPSYRPYYVSYAFSGVTTGNKRVIQSALVDIGWVSGKLNVAGHLNYSDNAYDKIKDRNGADWFKLHPPPPVPKEEK